MPDPIPYGQHNTKHRIRRFVQIAAILVVVCCTGFYSIRFAIRSVMWMRVCSQWESCNIATDTVIVDAEPAKYSGKPGSLFPLKGFIPSSRRNFPQLAASPWVGTGLLHAMKSPAGHARVVCVDLTAFDLIESGHTVRSIAIKWGVHELNRQSIREMKNSSFYFDIPPDARFRLFGASIDPKNSSHFWMNYEFMGQSGVIDGYLMDDDSVRIVPDGGTGGGPDPWNGWRPAAPPVKPH